MPPWSAYNLAEAHQAPREAKLDQLLAPIYAALEGLGQGSPIAIGALFLVLALVEFGVPFPFVLQGVRFFIGYELAQGRLAVLLLVLVFIAGRLAGSAGVYLLARLVGPPFVGFFRKRFRTVRDNMDKLQVRLNPQSMRSVLYVILGRFTPGLMVPTSLASGTIGLRWGYLALGVLVASLVFDVTFIALGVVWGREAGAGYSVYPWLVLVSGAVLACLWTFGRVLKKRGER